MQLIPIQSVPSQTVNVQLGNMLCVFSLYQKSTGFYIDVNVNGVTILTGVICQNLNRIIRSVYLNFDGDLCFIDTQGTDDPYYTDLGTRYVFVYLTPDDLSAQGLSS